MKIGLIMENSQSEKNSLVYNCLKKSQNNEVINFGMLEGDPELTYVQVGLLGAILLNSKCIDFIVTGCGTGIGASLSMNSFPNVTCGLIENDLDAFLFSQINAGNSVSIPFAKSFGWGSEIKLNYLFEKLFLNKFGEGYPIERRESEQSNKKKLDEIKKVTHKSMIEIVRCIDQEFLYNTINRDSFKNYFFKNSKDIELTSYLKKIMENYKK